SAGAAGSRTLSRLRAGHAAGRVVAAIVLLALGSLTWSRTRAFHDMETLWRDTLAKNPSAWMAHANLASLLHATAGRTADPEEQRLQLDQAESEYRAALALRPDNMPARINLAHLYEQRGAFAQAER